MHGRANHMAADAAAYTGFKQLKVKAWLRSGIQIELILCCRLRAARVRDDQRPLGGIQPVCG